jgi:hypothetical protein
MSTPAKPRLLGYGREVLRLHHHSIYTERAYCACSRRDVNYHTMTRWGSSGVANERSRHLHPIWQWKERCLHRPRIGL